MKFNIFMCFIARPSSPINTQIEMDVTSRQNSLTFESPVNYQSTNGIHVQNVIYGNCNKITFNYLSKF